MGDYSFVAFTDTEDSVDSDPKLYVRELYNLRLNANMVVLSACETGVGELQQGEGIIGMGRGFTYAGAASTVTSLWNVNDAQTAKLFNWFYEGIKSGLPKDEALRQAKLTYLENEVPADPFFWAGFIAMGNMDPIKVSQSNILPWMIAGALIIGLLISFISSMAGRRLRA